MQYEIKLMPQEQPSGAKFTGQVYMTCGYQEAFREVAPVLVIRALLKVRHERVNTAMGADYLQVCIYQGTRFWIIDDGGVITFLLPHEY
jgi:hypothetical protein